MRYGHFDTARDEYVIDRPDVPVSFTNYLGTKDYCVVLSHNARRLLLLPVAAERPGHEVPPERRPAGPPRALRLPARRRRRRLLVGVVAARRQAAGGRRGRGRRAATPPPTAWATRGSRPPTGGSTPARRSSSRSTTPSRCGTCGSPTPATPSARLTLATYVEFSFHTITIDNQNLQMSLYASGLVVRRRDHRVRLPLRAVDRALLRLQPGSRTPTTRCATASSGPTGPRPTRSPSSAATGRTGARPRRTTAARCSTR